MFEKVSQAAERLATRASRRDFLGRLGKGALALAGVLGGVLALPGGAQALGKWKGTYCCLYGRNPQTLTLCSISPCPPTYQGLPLSNWATVPNCRSCAWGQLG
jgi:hypothetical protein